MMKQEARQIPVTIAVMKVSGVVVRTPIERTRKGGNKMRCMKCGSKIRYESMTESGYWSCQDCSQPTMVRGE